MTRTLVAAAALVLLAGCGADTMPAAQDSPTPAPSTSAASSAPPRSLTIGPKPSTTPTTHPPRVHHPHPSPTHTSQPPTPVTKLLVFVVENHSLDQMRGQMPRMVALAQRYGYATDFHAITHPSLPNYVVMTSGSQHGVNNDDPPSRWRLAGHSIFGRALASGHTAGAYADSMPGNCHTENAGPYYVRHNPWTYFTSERAQCRRGDRSIGALAGDVAAGRLPNAGFVAPDACHDAHNCALSTADNWIADKVAMVMSGPDWRSGRLAIVVTADEDDTHSGNVVLTVVLHPSQHHHVVTTRLDHYSLYGLYEDVLGLPHNEDHRAASMAAAFGLPLGG